PSKPGTGTETTKPNKKPQTGDSTMLGLAAFFTMISLLGYVLLKKKEA
ncbi:LPXTG cell wall anchor domain-containing protein, partial [Catenibacterium sp. UBA627]